jgi:hypothetical protein
MIGSGIPISHSNPPRSIAASVPSSHPPEFRRLPEETHEEEKAMRGIRTKAGEAAVCDPAVRPQAARGSFGLDERRQAFSMAGKSAGSAARTEIGPALVSVTRKATPRICAARLFPNRAAGHDKRHVADSLLQLVMGSAICQHYKADKHQPDESKATYGEHGDEYGERLKKTLTP